MFKTGDEVIILTFAYPNERHNKDATRRYHYYDEGDRCVIEQIVRDDRPGEMNEYMVRRLNRKVNGFETQYVYGYQIGFLSDYYNNKRAAVFLSDNY